MKSLYVAKRLLCVTVILAVAVTTGTSGAPPASGFAEVADNTLASSASQRSASTPIPDDDTIGRWTVRPAGDERFTLTWTSPTDIRVGAARPELKVGGQLAGFPTLSPDGRQLSLTVAAAKAPDVDGLDVVLSGVPLDEPFAPAKAGAAASYTPLPGTTRLATDPGVRGPHSVDESDYELDSVRIPGLRIPVEMIGHVVEPEDSDPTNPLVVFLHGNHSICYEDPDGSGSGDGYWPCPEGTSPIPSHLGYRYVQRLLASQGYVTLSISANGVNAQGDGADGGSQARAVLIRKHLARWSQWVDAGTYVADLENVILVGHSRGGEGASRAGSNIPLSAPYEITGLVTVGPTSFTRQVTSYIPTVSLLPYCDGDVISSEGQNYTDLGRDLAADDTALRSSLMVMGANHNFFNTEWTPATATAPETAFDDWGGDPDATCGKRTAERLTAKEQRSVGRGYIAGAVWLLADHDLRVLPLFDGSRVSLASVGDADVRSHAVKGGRELRVPGRRVSLGPVNGATTRLCDGYARPGLILSKAAQRATCGRGISSLRTPHWPPSRLRGIPTVHGFEMAWTAAGQSGGVRFANPLDLTGADSLDLRTVVDVPTGNVRLRVAVHDAAGSVTVSPVGGSLLPALPDGSFSLAKRWAQTLRVSTDDLAGLDLSAITGFDLVGVSRDGRVWVLDAAAVRPGLAPIPVKRLPRISIGEVRKVEGDGPGEHTIPVPFTIGGNVSEPSRVVVNAQNLMDSSSLTPYVATIPAGVRTGTLDVPYLPDTRDDFRVQQYEMRVFGMRGIVGQEHAAITRLVDDDPTPTLRITRVTSAVTEGGSARWRASLSAPVDYEVSVFGRVVVGTTPLTRVTIADTLVPWRRHHVDPLLPITTPLHKADVFVSSGINRGSTTTLIAVPMRVDQVREGREVVTLRLRGYQFGPGVTSTIVIRNAG